MLILYEMVNFWSTRRLVRTYLIDMTAVPAELETFAVTAPASAVTCDQIAITATALHFPGLYRGIYLSAGARFKPDVSDIAKVDHTYGPGLITGHAELAICEPAMALDHFTTIDTSGRSRRDLSGRYGIHHCDFYHTAGIGSGHGHGLPFKKQTNKIDHKQAAVDSDHGPVLYAPGPPQETG